MILAMKLVKALVVDAAAIATTARTNFRYPSSHLAETQVEALRLGVVCNEQNR